ncbi:hypothetical protein CoNPh27_CDS0005 [Staphylococcus phage S-CoN_Ph27]|nr:hypothetical protein CoNPh27_CDS0005 [Staphylococcus phage S-CoN_Ph27]
MNNQRLLFIPIIKNKKMDRIEYNDRYGKPAVTYIVELDLDYKWINADNPEETFIINFYAVGEQTDPSKAFGTALTYSERYILLKSSIYLLTKMTQTVKKLTKINITTNKTTTIKTTETTIKDNNKDKLQVQVTTNYQYKTKASYY